MRIQANFGQSAVEFMLHNIHKLLAPGSMICLFLMLTVQTVSAHGNDRTIFLSNVPVGSYVLSAWASPAVLRSGEIHIEVTLLDQDGAPVQDALVYVTVSSLNGRGESLSTLVHPSAKGHLPTPEAAFWLGQPGAYRVDITIAGAAGRSGAASFDIEVLGVPVFVKALIHIQALASLLAGAWILKMGIVVWLRPGVREPYLGRRPYG